MPMRVAIIDLGTNSVRFDVHAIGQTGKMKLLHREKLMIRLGRGVFLRGRMDVNAIERAVDVFRHFRHVADGLRVRKVVAFGTSALREAQNSSQLLEKVKTLTGIEIKVISGSEEAKLIALGILSNDAVPKGRFALVDIGGGSTEITICQGRRALLPQSFPLGTARLQQVFLKRSPPKESQILQLREYTRNILAQGLGKSKSVDTVVGSSGTVRSVAKILGKKSFQLKELQALVKKMRTMSTTQLMDIPGMEPKRVDMILAGAILLEEILLKLGAKKVVPSEFSLRDGIIEEERRVHLAHKTSRIELHLEDLFSRAQRFGIPAEHLRQMVNLAGEIFDRLRSVHRLDPKWKIYLLSTIILRRSGEMVAFGDREKHAYYIVKNSDFSSIEGWEQEFIARLCLHHTGGRVGKDLSYLGKDKDRKEAFLKILALVRVVDALDIGPQTIIRLRKVEIRREFVKLHISGAGTAGIEQLMIERKKKLFEDVFAKSFLVQRRG